MSEEKLQSIQSPPPPAVHPKFELPPAVTIESLEALPKIGKAKAAELYDRIGRLLGAGVFNDAFRPAIDLVGASDEQRQQAERLIAEIIK
jgi:hypothetical protein